MDEAQTVEEEEDDRASQSTDISVDRSIGEVTNEDSDTSTSIPQESQNSMSEKTMKQDGIKILYTNADSLLGKRDLLKLLIQEQRPEVIAVSEILPKNQTNTAIDMDKEYAIQGYNMYYGRHCKRGVIIYVTIGLQSYKEQTLTELDYEEHVWCTICRINQRPLLIGCIYHSPNSTEANFSSLLTTMQSACTNNTKDILLVGDFNRPHINWNNWNVRNNDDGRFIEVLQDNFMHQKIERPTRYRHGQTPTLDDLVICSKEDLAEDIHYLDPLGKSDHICITFTIPNIGRAPQTSKTRHNMHKGDYSKLGRLLTESNWDMDGMELEEAWELFETNYNEAVRESIPTTPARPAKWRKPLWMNKQTTKAIKRKYWAWQRYKLTGSRQDYERYTQRRNSVQATSNKARREIEAKVAQQVKTNPKSFWTYVRKQMNTSQGQHPITRSDGTIATNDEEKAEIWSTFFASVFTEEDISQIPSMPELSIDAPLENINITEEEVHTELKKLKVEKSPGPDAIHPKVLKESAEILNAPLTKIFRKSLQQGEIPCDWKLANITPIHKKGEKSNAKNYRPVSLTSVVSKILERVIRSRLMEHLSRNNLLSDYQYGFRPKRSTTSQLLHALDHWTHWLDTGENFDVMYMDYAKAFDSVPHERLLKKVQAYGIRGRVFRWIEGFLKNRKQRVAVNAHYSSWQHVKSGIPQGSVLGPILFILYVNDLPEQLNNNILMYADDTKIYARVNSIEDSQKLQEDLDITLEWSTKWQLSFNLDKCKVMHYGRNNIEYEYLIARERQEKMQTTSKEKDLGITFTGDLKFMEHIANTVKKANQMVGIVKRTFKYMNKTMFNSIYKSLIRSHLESGNKIWAPIRKTDSDHLEKVQRRATKIVVEIRDLPYGERLKELKLHSLLYRRRRGDMIQVYKYLHGMEDSRNMFRLAEGNTRGHSLKLIKPRCNTSLRQNSFTHRVINDWNQLPENTINAPSIDSFKRRLDKHWEHLHYIF